jgi:serine/threonine-protein kinase
MLYEIDRLRATARGLAEDAEHELGSVAPHEPEERKRDGWRMQDRAQAAEIEADLLEVKRVEALRGALRIDPELGEGHTRLADHFRARHAAAEQRADVRGANELLHLLKTHDLQGAHAAYLDGSGRVTVVTDPPGAEVAAYRYEDRDRRRVAVPYARLGVTPIVDAPLPMGSYRLDLRHPERATARYPVLIERCTDWNGRPPGRGDAQAIRLLPRSELGPHDRYVPAGWTWTGGDPEAEWPRPREVLWLDGFVMREHPVTNREYVAFLDALVAADREDEAERYVPRIAGEPVYGRDGAGRYLLRRDAQGDDWLPGFPVLYVDWRCAAAYAAWEAERTGQPWRLPWELEREKAARGVDGRIHPWGDQYDPSWACVRESHAGSPTPRTVDHPTNDVSPYGIRNLSGNAMEWCLDAFRPTGPIIADPDLADTRAHRALRGAAWGGGARWCRASSRGMASPEMRESIISFRLTRSV